MERLSGRESPQIHPPLVAPIADPTHHITQLSHGRAFWSFTERKIRRKARISPESLVGHRFGRSPSPGLPTHEDGNKPIEPLRKVTTTYRC